MSTITLAALIDDGPPGTVALGSAKPTGDNGFMPLGSSKRKVVLRSGCVAFGALFVAAAGCAPRYVVSPPQQLANVSLPASSVTSYAIVVSLDGLRPDAIGPERTPTLHHLMETGSYSLTATTIMPSNTLPSHTSMLTGEPPERHLVKWNNVPAAKFDTVEVPDDLRRRTGEGLSHGGVLQQVEVPHPATRRDARLLPGARRLVREVDEQAHRGRRRALPRRRAAQRAVRAPGRSRHGGS